MSPPRRRLIAVLISVLGAAPVASAQQPPPKPAPGAAAQPSEEAELQRATDLYEGGKYPECIQLIRELIDPRGPRLLKNPDVVERARVYQAACFIGAGQPDGADEPLRAALRTNYAMKRPNSLIFPDPVLKRFDKVKEELSEEIRAAEEARLKRAQQDARAQQKAQAQEQDRINTLQELASQETVITKNRRWIALVPFGVGQFQNRDKPLGAAFLISEAVLATTAVSSMLVQLNLYAGQNELNADHEEIESRVNDWRTVLIISSYGFGAVALAGIIQAEIAFVPEVRETRRRQLPSYLTAPAKPAARVSPALTPIPGGAALGVRGVFEARAAFQPGSDWGLAASRITRGSGFVAIVEVTSVS